MSDHRDELFKQMWARFKEVILSGERGADYSSNLLPGIEVDKVYTDEEGLATVDWKVYLPDHIKNSMGYGHGGALTTLLDVLTWNSIISDQMYWPEGKTNTLKELFAYKDSPSLSRKINVRFVRPVVLDKEYTVTCKVISNSIGGGFIEGRVHDNGKSYVFGIQDLAKMQKVRTPKL